MFSGTRGPVTVAAAAVGAVYLAVFTVAWVLPASSVLRRSSGVVPVCTAKFDEQEVRRALLAEGSGNKAAAGGAIAKLWAQGTAAKRPAYWLPSELGVHHYTIAGELEPGEHALLHVWLVAKQRDDDGSVTLQGFGHLQPLDVLRADRNIGHWRMPNSAIGRLNQTGFLYLQHPATREHVNVTVVCEAVKGNNTDRLIVPFHIEADLSGLQDSASVNLRVAGWRRFAVLPLDHIRAHQPTTGAGNFRVAVWITPQVASRDVARLVTWHVRYHVALGFSEEVVYLYPDQLAACLADDDIMRLVKKSQLRLVLIEGFLEHYNWGRNEFTNNTFDVPDDPGVTAWYTDQMQVVAHMLLANLQDDVQLLLCDPDEYLALDAPASLADTFDDCLQVNLDDCLKGRGSALYRATMVCEDCGGGPELSLWTGAAEAHPLRHYRHTQADLAGMRRLCDIKSIVRPTEVLSMGVHKAEITRSTQPATAKDAQACGVRLLHAINMYDRRFNVTKAATDGHFTNVTDWQWVL